MKVKSYLRCICLAAMSSLLISCGTPKEFSTLKGEKDIDIIHIPRGVGLIANSVGFFSSDRATREALKGFSSMDIVCCERRGNRKKVSEAIGTVLEKDRGELLIEVVEGREAIYIYGRPDTKKKKIKDVLIVCDEPSDMTVIRFKGTFNIKDIVEGCLTDKKSKAQKSKSNKDTKTANKDTQTPKSNKNTTTDKNIK